MKGLLLLSYPVIVIAMMKFALYSYIPQRFQRRATFEEQDICRMIIGFKDGRNVYTRWAARQFSRALAAMDLTDTVIVCIPASTKYAHIRRWKRFSQLLCKQTGAIDGFSHIEVCGNRKRAHITGEYELATNIKHLVTISEVRTCWSSTISTPQGVHRMRSSVPSRPQVHTSVWPCSWLKPDGSAIIEIKQD